MMSHLPWRRLSTVLAIALIAFQLAALFASWGVRAGMILLVVIAVIALAQWAERAFRRRLKSQLRAAIEEMDRPEPFDADAVFERAMDKRRAG